MLLKNKTAVVYGAGGAIGEAVARALAREGARVFLTGRNRETIEALAKDIVLKGGFANAQVVDALDEEAVNRHLDSIIKQEGKLDISFNATGIPQTGVQGIPLVELTAEGFINP